MDVRTRRGILFGLPLLLLLPGGLLFLRDKHPLPAPPDRSLEDVERLLEDVIRKHRVETAKPPPCMMGQRQEGVGQLHRLGSLLTRVYPDLMETLLLARAQDASRPSAARAFCIALLGELSRSGRSNVDATLHELARSADRGLSGIALAELSAGDLSGRHLELYRSRCPDRMRAAFEAVPYWTDAASITELEWIVAISPGMNDPDYNQRRSAEEALQKIRLLFSEDRDSLLQKILEGSSGQDDWLEWAVKIAKMRHLPFALGALRRRLDLVENPLPADASPDQRRDFAMMERTGGTVAEQLAMGRSPGPYHTDYDDALIAYAELGGELNDIERRRLTGFGYAGDPRKRLEELLSSGR